MDDTHGTNRTKPALNASLPTPRFLEPHTLASLACPVCFGGLRLSDSREGVLCAGCDRMYPLIDGIAVLIRERATGGKPSFGN